MRIVLLRSAVFMSVIMLLGCGKPDLGPDGKERRSALSSGDITLIERYIVEQRAAIEEAGRLKPKAFGGDLEAAKRWKVLTSYDPRVKSALDVLKYYKESDAIKAKRTQLKSMLDETRDLGWGDIRPSWISAKLGDAEAQNELHEFFAQGEGLRRDERALKIGDSWDPELRDIEVLTYSSCQLSYAYLVDDFWTPPAGMWDPFYVEGRYRYDGIEFAPRDWLVKAAASNPRYRAKLAAVDFISAKDEDARLVAAKALLSLYNINGDYEGRDLVESCLAAIYRRGIAVQPDIAKAVQIMLSSRDKGLWARGVKLVCENNLPVHEKYHRVSGRVGEELVVAVGTKYGFGGLSRDFELAYFEYWLFLHSWGASSSDANFARRELDELERGLSHDEVVSLQKKCWIWGEKFKWQSPSYEDWKAR